MYAYVFEDGRFDVGNKLDYLKATIELAIDREDVGQDVPRLARRLRRSARSCLTSRADSTLPRRG